jgi:hypothetical protein
VLLYLICPATGLEGLCAVVPVGTTNPPVVDCALITPPIAVSVKLPVVSPVTVIAVVIVFPADIVLIKPPK